MVVSIEAGKTLKMEYPFITKQFSPYIRTVSKLP